MLGFSLNSVATDYKVIDSKALNRATLDKESVITSPYLLSTELPYNTVGLYAGVDLQSRHMEFDYYHSKSIVNPRYLQGNIYGALKFHSNFGIEVGYEQGRQSVSKMLATDEYFFNYLYAFPLEKTAVKTSISGPHINLVGYLTISTDFLQGLSLMASAGLAHLQLKIDARIWDDYLINPNPIAYRSFVKKTWVPRFSVGFQQMINDQVGIRGLISWEGTHKFRNIRDRVNINPTILQRTATVGNSLTPSLGIFYKF